MDVAICHSRVRLGPGGLSFPPCFLFASYSQFEHANHVSDGVKVRLPTGRRTSSANGMQNRKPLAGRCFGFRPAMSIKQASAQGSLPCRASRKPRSLLPCKSASRTLPIRSRSDVRIAFASFSGPSLFCLRHRSTSIARPSTFMFERSRHDFPDPNESTIKKKQKKIKPKRIRHSRSDTGPGGWGHFSNPGPRRFALEPNRQMPSSMFRARGP